MAKTLAEQLEEKKKKKKAEEPSQASSVEDIEEEGVSSPIPPSLDDRLSKAQKDYESGKKTAAYSELAEKLGNALIKMGAARTGLKKGVDLSKIDTTETDWDKRRKGLLDEYKTELADIQNVREEERKALAPGEEEFQQTGFLTKEGNPIVFYKNKGLYFDSLTRQPVSMGDIRAKSLQIRPDKVTGEYSSYDAVTNTWLTVDKEGNPRSLSEQEIKEQFTDANLDPNQRKDVKAALDRRDKLVGKKIDNLEEIERAKALIDQNNPIGAEAVKTLLAKGVMGEVGNLAQAEQERFGGSKEIVARMEQAYQTYVGGGNLSDRNQAYLLDLLDEMERATSISISTRVDDIVDEQAGVIRVPGPYLQRKLLPRSVANKLHSFKEKEKINWNEELGKLEKTAPIKKHQEAVEQKEKEEGGIVDKAVNYFKGFLFEEDEEDEEEL